MARESDLRVTDVELGRITGEGIVKVDVRLEWQERPFTTVDHEISMDSGYWSFAVMGSMWKRRDSSDCYEAGQGVVEYVARLGTPEARELARLWKRWHLNGMHAGCAHQVDPKRDEGDAYDPKTAPVCPETGYRWGHAWLVEEIPDTVLAEIRDLVSRIAPTEG